MSNLPPSSLPYAPKAQGPRPNAVLCNLFTDLLAQLSRHSFVKCEGTRGKIEEPSILPCSKVDRHCHDFVQCHSWVGSLF